MIPKAPHLYGTIKLHKEHKPIRPIVNWRDNPGYKLTKYIATQLSEKLQLPYVYDVKDSIELIHNLENLQTDENTKLCSFDVTNMYRNIPKIKTKHNISEVLIDNKTPTVEKQELEILLNTIFEHNYVYAIQRPIL
jgi:hypothetical protein